MAKAGGPTVKNVSGFDLCRLLVGSLGTLGLHRRRHPAHPAPPGRGAVVRAPAAADPFALFRALYRPVSLLWDGTTTWVRLEGHAGDLRQQAADAPAWSEVERTAEPAAAAGRRCRRPTCATSPGTFVAEVGVGVVHRDQPVAGPPPSSAVVDAPPARSRSRFDPTGRLNPGRDPLAR